jgi:hypothetical protein
MLSESTPFSIAALKLPAEKRVNEFGLNDCWQSTELSRRAALIIRPDTFRAMMAEAAYLAKYSSFGNSTTVLRTLDHNSFATGTDDRTFIDLADCVVVANKSDADSLLRATPGSDAERATAGAMASTIKGCTQNAEVEVLVPTIRALAAYGLWMHYVKAGS